MVGLHGALTPFDDTIENVATCVLEAVLEAAQASMLPLLLPRFRFRQKVAILQAAILIISLEATSTANRFRLRFRNPGGNAVLAPGFYA